MSTLNRLAAEATDDSFRVAIAVGLTSVPVSLLLSWGVLAGNGATTQGQFDGLAVLVAGVIVGYYYHGRSTSTKRAGIWTGLTGGLAALIVFGLPSLGALASMSGETVGVVLVLAPVFTALGVGLSVAVAVIAALGTDWFLHRVDPDHPSRESVGVDGDSQPRGSRWWIPVVGYAVVAPVWLTVLLWPDPTVFASGRSFLSAFGLFASSTVAFIALFLDATAPRAGDAWQPRWWLYVGVPPVVASLVYLTATVRGSGYPTGDATFGFYIALAAVTVVYAVVRHRHIGTVSSLGEFE